MNMPDSSWSVTFCGLIASWSLWTFTSGMKSETLSQAVLFPLPGSGSGSFCFKSFASSTSLLSASHVLCLSLGTSIANWFSLDSSFLTEMIKKLDA